ncbi:Protein dispatched 3 [Bulinus truncatus]|nr:Protein dispatched 3 [Bulinus truncatus]
MIVYCFLRLTMRWMKLFRSNNGWEPVSNTDEFNDTGMDDLMRMAGGDYQENENSDPLQSSDSQNNSCSHHLEEPVFHQSTSQPSVLCTPTYITWNINILNQPCFCSLPKLKFPMCKWYLIVLSIFITLAFISLNVGLGYYGIFVYKPDLLVIDKSVKSFSIPNHEAYIHYESFMLAKKNVTVRYRRSVDNFTVNNYFNFSSVETKPSFNVHQVLRKPVFFKKQEATVFSNVFSLPESHGEDWTGTFRNINRRQKRASSQVGCLYEYQSRAKWKMHVIYLADGDNDKNMFTKERLQTAHEIERKIMQHPDFVNFCLRDPYLEKYIPALQNMGGCVPPNSLLTYFFPSQDVQGRIYYDEMGTTIGDIDSALKMAMNHESFYFVDDKINKTYPKSQLLRTEILFGVPLQGYCSGEGSKKDQDDKFRNFIVTYIDLLSKASTEKVRVLYGGNEIFDYEVTTTFWNDVRLAVISLVAIFILMLVLSLSLFLTIVGIVVIGLSFPISLFFYRVVFGINALGILNGAAAFVIIGIGVDDVFVFINVYRQAAHLQSFVQRIKYTIKVAGVATFFTSFTTAAAFAANIASSIPAVHDFGLFMSLIVSACWISVFILMPPALYLYACIFEPLEIFLFSCLCCCHNNKVEVNEGFTQDLAGENGIIEDDDDVQMLNIEANDNELPVNLCDDEMLLMDDPYSTVGGRLRILTDNDTRTTEQEVTNHTDGEQSYNENVYLGKLIYRFLMFLTDRLVIPARYIVIGVSVVLLIISCVLMSRLRPSTHPPQLFRPDTNIQQLLDLKANFSFIDAVQCDRCSGLYSLNHSSGMNPPPSVKSDSTPATPFNNPATEGTLASPFNNPATDAPGQPTQPPFLPPTARPVVSEETTTKSYTWTLPWRTTTTSRSTPLTTYRDVMTTYRDVMTTYRDVMTTVMPGYTADTVTKKLIPVNNTFDPCLQQSCNNLKDRPLLESGATIYVVFGVLGIDRSKEDVGHVIDQYKSTTVFDSEFSKAFDFKNGKLKEYFKELCSVCNMLANNTELVKPGSAQCIPDIVSRNFLPIIVMLQEIPECRNLPNINSINPTHAQARAEGGLNLRTHQLIWLAFAFESTTSESQAYFDAYKHYEKWEALMSHIKSSVLSPGSPLKSMFQTSQFWTKVMMEVVAVNSAIYGLVLSMIICVISVAIFTGHLLLLLIIVIAIIAMICCVVGIFYLAGWEMGAVEAVSLSILVGSSVDYCVHIVEGYILAGKKVSLSIGKSASDIRKERASHAVRHIGVAIVCSALTTIIAAVPLTQTVIQPFSKFGSILLINTTVSLVMTMTLAVALLAVIAPARYRGTWKSYLKATVSVIVLTGAFFLSLFIASKAGLFRNAPHHLDILSKVKIFVWNTSCHFIPELKRSG